LGFCVLSSSNQRHQEPNIGMFMEPQIEAPGSSRFDSLLLAASVALLAGGMVAFYWLSGDVNVALRALVLLASVGVALALAYRTAAGKALWSYVIGSRTELRKVVWPSRQESLQATLMIAVVVLIMSLLLWGLDALLLLGVKSLTGRG
jgi:preprotein translocase subunit SecE